MGSLGRCSLAQDGVTPCVAALMDMALMSMSAWRGVHVPRLPARRPPKASFAGRFGPWSTVGICVARRASAESRNRALQEELGKLDLSFEDLDQANPLLYSAIRCCKAFVLPSPRALAVTNQPGRARVVARDVARLVREARVAEQRWEATRARDLGRQVVLVMDCVRSVQNVRALLSTCAAAGAAACFAGITPRPPMPQVTTQAAAMVPGSWARSGREAVLRLQSQGYEARTSTSDRLLESFGAV